MTTPVPLGESPGAPNPPQVLEWIEAFLDQLGVTRDRRLATALIADAVGLATDGVDTLDLKIATSAVSEMRDAFRVFEPYESVPKVTIFGSARTRPDDPVYQQASRVAAALAEQGWMVVTGAGPGIMQAGMEGAGRDRSIGVAIRLPFEQAANPVIAGSERYVSMKYFFTRKLMLVKESQAFVCLPGGFGTLDETFELLTLVQTGKGIPVPIVLLDTPNDPYWEHVDRFVTGELVPRGLVSAADVGLYRVTDSCQEAVDEIGRFYANFDSLRYVGDQLVIRVRHAPDDAQLAELNERFGHLARSGRIDRTEPLPVEVRDQDRLDLARIRFRFAMHGFGDLRRLIDTLNGFVA